MSFPDWARNSFWLPPENFYAAPPKPAKTNSLQDTRTSCCAFTKQNEGPPPLSPDARQSAGNAGAAGIKVPRAGINVRRHRVKVPLCQGATVSRCHPCETRHLRVEGNRILAFNARRAGIDWRLRTNCPCCWPRRCHSTPHSPQKLTIHPAPDDTPQGWCHLPNSSGVPWREEVAK